MGRRRRSLLGDRPETALGAMSAPPCPERLITAVMDEVRSEGTARRVQHVRACCAETLLKDLPVPAAPPSAVERPLMRLRARVRADRVERPAPSAIHRMLLEAAGATVAALLLALAILARAPGSVPTPALAPSAPLVELTVLDVRGAVEVVRSGIGAALARGALLGVGDRIRTPDGGGVTLRLGTAVRLVIDGASEMRLAARREQLAELELLAGRLEGDIGPGEPARFAVANGPRRLEVVGGRVGVLRLAADELALAALDDSQVAIDQRAVSLGRGQLLRIGRSGERVDTLPAELRLRVEQAAAIAPGATEARFTGKTGASVLLVIDRRPVDVGSDGRFSAHVALPPGAEQIEVVARDASGREARQRLRLVRAAVRGQWKEPG